MNLSRNVAEIIREHVTLEVESIDRMYLNVYQPQLQRDLGVVGFFRYHRGQPFASSSLMSSMTRTFVASIESFAKAQRIPVITFQKGQRKDDIAKSYRAKFTKEEGVIFIGKAQEKASVFRTEKRYHEQSGQTYPWLVRSTAMVNHYYIYALSNKTTVAEASANPHEELWHYRSFFLLARFMFSKRHAHVTARNLQSCCCDRPVLR